MLKRLVTYSICFIVLLFFVSLLCNDGDAFNPDNYNVTGLVFTVFFFILALCGAEMWARMWEKDSN